MKGKKPDGKTLTDQKKEITRKGREDEKEQLERGDD